MTHNLASRDILSLRYNTLLGQPSTAVHNNDDPTTATTSHALVTAPVFTGDALIHAGEETFAQYALYGEVLSQRADGFPTSVESPQLFVNSNAPFSAVVCGVQGSGKSHSTSVLLEGCLMKDQRLGTLPAPLSGLMFHFDTAAGGGCVQPCEAAYLSSLDASRGGEATPPQVTVLVLPNSLRVMREVYSGLPNVEVQPLRFAPEDISAERLLCMMKVDTESQMPLYMEFVLSYLRSIESFDYGTFRKALKSQGFNGSQKSMLNLRLNLLDACLEGGTRACRVSGYFGQGRLVIIDLSSPFMDPASACGFFDMILGLFIEAETDASGKIVVLDEAHKYLTDNTTSSRLTESLLSVIRQQRHLATRVVISTQEPTVVPAKFLDLCSFVVAHRFSSPQWLAHLLRHVAARTSDADAWFQKLVSLQTGEGMLFAPSGYGVCDAHALRPLGPGYLLVRARLRITRDGGHSVLAVADPARTTRLARVSADAASSVSELSAPASRLASSMGWSAVDADVSISVGGAPDETASEAPSVDVAKFRPLLDALAGLAGGRATTLSLSALLNTNRGAAYPAGGLHAYLDEAVACGLVRWADAGSDGSTWVELVHTPRVDAPAIASAVVAALTFTSPAGGSSSAGQIHTMAAAPLSVPSEFLPLIDALQAAPERRMNTAKLGQVLIAPGRPAPYPTGKGKFAKYIDKAVALGLVKREGTKCIRMQ